MDTSPDDAQRRIVQNAARMRVLGLWLVLLPVAVVLHERQAPAIMWALAAANVLVWPWVARRMALAHARPLAMERRNLHVDALMAGLWVALMQFNAVPSLALASIVLMDKFAFGGARLALRCGLVFLASAAVTTALGGFAFSPESSWPAIAATAPALLLYPSAIALSAWRLSQQLGAHHRALSSLVRLDPLTGVANARALQEAAEHEFRRFRRSGHRASFMVVDVDRFRLLNDVHGRAAGDAALQAIAAVLRKTLRDTDTCGRLGDDRFGVVLADASGSGVGELAERLRHAFAGRLLKDASGGHPTVSIGYAQIDAGMLTSTQWIAAAESALRLAKAAGRNRSMSAPAFGPPPS
ncbi:diguanylate cyclase AdrA [Silanimonas algicola]